MGPFAGSKGGEVVYEGDFAGFDFRYADRQPHEKAPAIKEKVRKRSGELKIGHGRLNNLRMCRSRSEGCSDSRFGGRGLGKSSLITGCLPQAYPETIIIDQNLARGRGGPTRRPIPAFSIMCASLRQG